MASPVKQCALAHNIKVFQPEKIRKEYEDIVALNPDLIVTAAYGQLVGMKLLNAPNIDQLMCMLHYYQNIVVVHQSIKQLKMAIKKRELPLCIWKRNGCWRYSWCKKSKN